MMVIKQVIGIDVAKEELVARLGSLCHDQRQTFCDTVSFENSLQGIRRLIRWAKKITDQDVPLWFVMEATGSYHETLAYTLSEKTLPVSVLLPTQTRAYATSLNLKSKTDPIDAKMLAQFGLERSLTPWQAPSPRLRILKAYTREYQTLQESKTALINYLHAKEHAYQIPQDTKKRLQDVLRLYKKQLKTIEQKIEKQIESDPELQESITRIARVKGLGRMTIAIIVAETNGFATFENTKQITSFVGYDMVHHQSGKTNRKTRISKKGNARIRAALYWPAITAVRCNQHFKTFYDRIMTTHTAKMVGYVAVARKLLTLIFTLWKNKTEYNPNYHNQSLLNA